MNACDTLNLWIKTAINIVRSMSDSPDTSVIASHNGQPHAAMPTSLETLSLAELVDRVKNKDNAGSDELYRRVFKAMKAYFNRHLGFDDAENCANDAFEIVVDNIQKGQLAEPKALMGYMKPIMNGVRVRKIEENIRRRELMDANDTTLNIQDNRPNPEEALLANERHEFLERSMARLREKDRLLLELASLEEVPRGVIARKLGFNTESSLNSAIFNAKQRLGRASAALVKEENTKRIQNQHRPITQELTQFIKEHTREKPNVDEQQNGSSRTR